MNISKDSLLPRVAIVEDDSDLRQSMHDYLAAKGYPVWAEGSAEEFYKRMLVAPVDVVVLDVGLPGESGLAVTRHLRTMENVVIIILSGRSILDDRLRGLAEGADRYLVKPVDLRELAANISACARGLRARKESADQGESWRLVQSDLTLVSPRGAHIALTSREWMFVHCVVDRERRMASRQEIAEALHGANLDGFDYHRIDMLVSRLRKKITAVTGGPSPIRTLQGRGFLFSEKCILI